MDKLFSSNKQKKIDASNKLFDDALNNWRKAKKELKGQYEKELANYEELLVNWKENKKSFESEKQEKMMLSKRKKSSI